MANTETQLSKQIGEQFDKLALYHLRLNSGKVKVRGGWLCLCPEGTPDRVALVSDQDGLVALPLFCEVKRPGETPSIEQRECHAMIQSKGGLVVVAESVADVWAAVQQAKKRAAWIAGMMKVAEPWREIGG